jgi:integrase
MRRGELLKLRWREVDLERQSITITALNSKTARARTIAMTPRVCDELNRLWNQSPKDSKVLVFGIVDTVKRSWRSACKKAKIEDVRFHDLRHTALTRMIQAGIQPLEVMKISGHTQMVTFTRYINPTGEAVQQAADRLADFHAAAFERLRSEAEQSQTIN